MPSKFNQLSYFGFIVKINALIAFKNDLPVQYLPSQEDTMSFQLDEEENEDEYSDENDFFDSMSVQEVKYESWQDRKQRSSSLHIFTTPESTNLHFFTKLSLFCFKRLCSPLKFLFHR